MARGHNLRERRLFTDLAEKNRLSAELRRVAHSMRRWQDQMNKRRSKRWQAQYRSSIERAGSRLEVLEREVLAQAKDLKSRIEEELDISVQEVSQFEEQYKKELDELVSAQKELREAEEARVQTEAAAADQTSHSQETAELLSKLRRRHRRTERQVRREAKDVTSVEREIASEERDKEVLTKELQRVIEEVQALRQA